LDSSSLYHKWFPRIKEEAKGLPSWLRCFLIFFFEWLLDPKFVDLVSLNYGVDENYINPLCKALGMNPLWTIPSWGESSNVVLSVSEKMSLMWEP
jgi:hypothetical protein